MKMPVCRLWMCECRALRRMAEGHILVSAAQHWRTTFALGDYGLSREVYWRLRYG